MRLTLIHCGYLLADKEHLTTEDPKTSGLLYKLEERPPFAGAAFAGFQHLLAMFGGILAAPLLVAVGMGLDASDTTYLISAAMVVSGFATLVQINRFGMLGTGLLSVQGTSFAFIGPLVFSYEKLVVDRSSDEALGVIFGSSAICALVVMFLSIYIRHLKHVITNNVAGVTIILIGLSLVHSTLEGIAREFSAAGGQRGDGVPLIALAATVFVVILVFARQGRAWLRLSSITLGLGAGILASMLLGIADFSGLGDVPYVFSPEVMRYPVGIELQVIAILLPIYLVSAMESVGDITATSNLSGLPTEGREYWTRIRGGVMAGAFASFAAALVSTFPSTTFSQNNGVIRLTGVASRHVGKFVAVFLVLLGLVPAIAALFQAVPVVVVFGATLLMFLLVAVSGFRVVQDSDPRLRDYLLVALAILMGYGVATYIDLLPGLPSELVTVFQFPVSTGAVLAILLEFIVPGRVRGARASA